MPGGSVHRARAFAPAHVSGVFVPRLEARDPRGRGSLGAGLVLEPGVTASATWQPGGPRRTSVTSDSGQRLPISEEVARRLAGPRVGALDVRLRHDLPIGHGFGTSAAGALATGLAVAGTLGLPRRKAVETAHLADLFGGGGLGGVAAIVGGGLEVRLRPGVPPFGQVRRLTVDHELLVGSVGPPLRSWALLRGPAALRRFEEGAELFDRIATDPGWESFWDAAERFTDVARLAPPRLRAVLRGLRRRKVRSAQAMFGRTYFAEAPGGREGAQVRRWLEREGVPFRQVAIARRGAHALPGAPG